MFNSFLIFFQTDDDMITHLLQFIDLNETNITPLPTPDTYIKTLLNVWDMYIDPDTNRLYYVNKETNEWTYQPPRHPNKVKTGNVQWILQRVWWTIWRQKIFQAVLLFLHNSSIQTTLF